MGRANAEEDDLVQEGLIHVWERLRRGQYPARDYIFRRQLDWVRYLQKLERGDSISYEEAMEDPQEWLITH